MLTGARRCALLACVGVLAVASGCGSPPPPQASYAARAQAVCASALRQARDLTSSGPPAGTAAPGSGYAGRLVWILTGELAALRRLPPPPAARAAIERYLTALGRARDELAVLARPGAAAGNAAAPAAAAALRALPVAALARAAGLPACGATTTR